MSKEALAKVVQRAISDGAFRRQLSSDPATALRGFDLSADESAAIRSGDSGRLSSLGVDLRMSKAFTISGDQATGDAIRPVLSNDLGASFTGASSSAGQGAAGSSALSGGNASAASSALSGGNASAASSALSSGNASGASSALSSGNAGDNDPLISAGTNAGRDEAITGADPAHAFGSQTTGDQATAFGNVLSPGDNGTDGVLISDDQGHSGAMSPGEASGGPNISE